jgi:NAD(P)-dependent dehydrogenase (short-subunit alcohol dehydrogenase family)
MRLQGKVAVVTGAGSGIGLETSLLFAKEGCKVVCADISNAGQQVADKINSTHPGAAVFIKCDVSKEVQVQACVNLAESHFGKLNIMFNNAGIMHPNDDNAMTTDENVWDLTYNINVKGVWYGCRHAIPAMLRSGEACSIINTASFVAKLGAATPQLACIPSLTQTLVPKVLCWQ